MRTEVWVLDPGLGREEVEGVLGSLVARDVRATLREYPEGRVLLVPDPPPGLERPPGVLRASSLEVPSAAQVTRRTFLDRFGAGLAAATLGTGAVLAGLYAVPPPLRRDSLEELDIGPLAEIQEKGSKRFRFGREPCVAVWSGGRVFALSTICSHLGCLVEWAPDRGHLACPCHRASFDLEGNVLEGPPPRPLRTFLVSVEDGRVVVRRRTAA